MRHSMLIDKENMR